MFVTLPSKELSLMEEKREVEAEAELSATPTSSKVKGAACPPDLGGSSVGPSTWPEKAVLGVVLTGVFPSTLWGFCLSLPKLHLPQV